MQTATESTDLRSVQGQLEQLKSGVATVVSREKTLIKERAERLLTVRREMVLRGEADAVRYRVPVQPSLDGNTVELPTEQTAFAENAVQYRTTLAFLEGRVATITRALKGE